MAALGAAVQSRVKGMDDAIGVTGKDTAWKFSFTFPTGCTPLPVYLGVSLDPCQWQTKIHALMSMLWIFTTIGFCIWMVGDTLKGK